METEVIEVSHLLTRERFRYSCQFYLNGTTPLLEEAGVEVINDDFPTIRLSLEIILNQEDMLFPNDIRNRAQKPDFKLEIPELLTVETYMLIL